MVSLPLLVFLVVGQLVLLVVAISAVLVAHGLGRRRDARRAAQLATARDVVQRHLGRRLLREEAERDLADLDPVTLTTLLNELAAQRVGDDRERAFRLFRGTPWYLGVAEQAASKRWWRRLRAARALSTLAEPEHLLLVHRLLEDPAPAVRLAAAAALERLPSPGLASSILERAIAAHGAERNHLIEILAVSETLALPVMIRRFEEADDEDTVRVLLALTGRVRFTNLLSRVVIYADSESLEVRIAVATCLRNFPHPQTANALRRLLTDAAWQVRARAAASLGAIGAIEAIPDLAFSMQDPNWWVRLRSAVALRLVGPRGIEALREVTRSRDRFAADMARYVLGLDDGAMAEYVGGASFDFATASGVARAS